MRKFYSLNQTSILGYNCVRIVDHRHHSTGPSNLDLHWEQVKGFQQRPDQVHLINQPFQKARSFWLLFFLINWRDSCSIESLEVVHRLHQPSIGFLIISVPNYISFLCFNDVLLLSKIPFTSCPKNTFYMHDLLLWPVQMKVFTVPEQLFVEMILDCSSNLGTLDIKRRTCLRFHTIQIYTYRNKTYLKAVMFWHTLYISNVLS